MDEVELLPCITLSKYPKDIKNAGESVNTFPSVVGTFLMPSLK